MLEEEQDGGSEHEFYAEPDEVETQDDQYLIRRGRRNEGPSRRIRINRDGMDENQFEEDYTPSKRRDTLLKKFVETVTPPEPIRTSLRPPMTKNEWLNFFLVRLPILEWVWTYRPSYFVGDIISGITVAIMHIPQGLAYALLATLPAVYGLYASVMPVVVYSILGTSKHISVGTFAVVELMIGNAIQRTLGNPAVGLAMCQSGVNLTDAELEDVVVMADNSTILTCGNVKRDIALCLALMTGLVMLGLGLLRCGFITIFLSSSLVSGYTTGAAIHVFTSQLKHIAGITIPRYAGALSVPKTWLYFFGNIPYINSATAIISIISIIFLIIFKISNKLLNKHVKIPCKKYKGRSEGWITEKIKWMIPIPSQLIVVIVATLMSANVGFEHAFNVTVVGDIPKGAPEFSVPNLSYGLYLIQDAFVIAIVTYSVTVSLVQVFAKEYQYDYDNNQEFIAYGMMNIVGSFFSSFPAAGSLSRSSVQANAGGKTQLVGFISTAIILVVLIALGQLFQALPNCVLASIIWVALYGMFKQFGDVWTLLKISVWDLTVWLVVFVATVLLGVDLGLGVGVAYSLLCLVLRTILPVYSVLGQVQGTEIYRNKNNFQKIKPVPGVLIFRFLGPVCFVNSRVFRARMEMVTGLYGNMSAMQKDGCLQQLWYSLMKKSGKYPVTSEEPVRMTDLASDSTSEDSSQPSSPPSNVARSLSFQQAVAVDIVGMDSTTTKQTLNGASKNKKTEERIHTVIVDCAPISYLDAVGVKTIENVVVDFDRCGVQVIFAAMIKENRDVLIRSEFRKKCGKKWLFPTVQDAVDHAKTGKRLKPRTKKEKKVPIPIPIVAPDLPGESPLHLSSKTTITDQVVNEVEAGETSATLPTAPAEDGADVAKVTSDTESFKDKDD